MTPRFAQERIEETPQRRVLTERVRTALTEIGRMAMKPWQLAAPRWALVFAISSLVFLLGVTAEYAREQHRDNEMLREEAQRRFQEVFSDDIRVRLFGVELAERRHSAEHAELYRALRARRIARGD